MAVATPIYAGRNETRHQTLLRELDTKSSIRPMGGMPVHGSLSYPVD